MNWLGAGLRALLAAILGCTAGAIVFIGLRRHGLDLVPVVGLLAGLATASVSRERSGPRGVVIGALSLWAAALAEILAWPGQGFLHDVIHFHDRLGGWRLLLYVLDAILASVLGGRAFVRPREPRGERRRDVVR